MLSLIDNLNYNYIAKKIFLISFDVVNIFPSIPNKSGIKGVQSLRTTSSILYTSTSCIFEYLYLIMRSIYKQMGQLKIAICVVFIVTLLWLCIMNKHWTVISNLWFENVLLMLWLHDGFTAMKMQIIILNISTLLMHQVSNLQCNLKIKLILNF